MDLKIKILAEGRTLTVQDNTLYLTEGYSFFNYKKEDCVPIILIESHETTLKDNEIPKLMVGGFGKSIDISKDGYITLHYVVLPTKKWIESNETLKIISQLTNPYLFYVDDNKIIGPSGDTINYQELLTIIHSDNVNLNICKTHKEYVNILNLYNCYINLCLQIFQQHGFSKCLNKNKLDDELIYNRDLIWMAINVINYYVDRYTKDNNTLINAQQIIEMIHSCNGICQENGDIKLTINYECGCSKR